jgi:hypothetical protein
MATSPKQICTGPITLSPGPATLTSGLEDKTVIFVEPRKVKSKFSFEDAIMSFRESVPDEEKPFIDDLCIAANAIPEPDAEKVANELIDDLYSRNEVKAEAAYQTLNHMIGLYDLCTVPYVEDPLVDRMIDATKRYESNKKQAEARIAHELTHAYAALSNGG